MKKILTLFTAFAVALVFTFLVSGSPPTLAAEKLNAGKFSAEITLPLHNQSAGSERFAAFPTGGGFTVTYKDLTPIEKRFERAADNYQTPNEHFFSGFDKPARAKI